MNVPVVFSLPKRRIGITHELMMDLSGVHTHERAISIRLSWQFCKISKWQSSSSGGALARAVRDIQLRLGKGRFSRTLGTHLVSMQNIPHQPIFNMIVQLCMQCMVNKLTELELSTFSHLERQSSETESQGTYKRVYV